MENTAFSGSMTALITPFQEDRSLDRTAFERLVAWQIEQGAQALVPCGTTGETPTLSDEECFDLISLCVRTAKGRVPVIAGCGSNATQHAIFLTKQAVKAGADAVLQVVPYYNKPSQEGLFLHFKAIHDECPVPLFLYNIPGRSVVALAPDTIARLAALPRIVGIKDATGNLAAPLKTKAMCGADFIQLSGNDDTVLAFLAQGGHGCISVVSNIAPALCAKMHAAWQNGDIATAQRINEQLAPLAEALFVETSPAPVKYAAAKLGLCKNILRLPMAQASKSTQEKFDGVWQQLQLIINGLS